MKIVIDISDYACVETLKELPIIDEISKQVAVILEKQNQRARESFVIKACKNSVSLLLSKKKDVRPKFLSIYLPINSIESTDDSTISTVSSDKNVLDNIMAEDGDIIDNHTNAVSIVSNSKISFSIENDVVIAEATFDYLADYFKYSLSANSKPMNIEDILTDICRYAFAERKCSLNIRTVKQEVSRQISHILKSARERAHGNSIIGILRTKSTYRFTFNAIDSLNQCQESIGYTQYRNNQCSSPILFIKEHNNAIAIFQFYPSSKTIEITINEVFVNNALYSFNLTRTLDISEISSLITECVCISNVHLDMAFVEEMIKTKILFERSKPNSHYFLSVVVGTKQDLLLHQVTENNDTNSSHSSYEEEIEAKIGRVYTTRGIKRSYVEDPISIEPRKNMHRHNKIIKDQRDLLYIKDAYHITDSAFNAIIKYAQSDRSLCSLKEIERLRKDVNSRLPIQFAATCAFVKFEYAVRTAIFVARYYEPMLDNYDKLTIRINMDGTLIGNKHIVAISINCIEGGHQSQTSKNLVPLGLFEIEKENTDMLRKTLPKEFIDDIKTGKCITVEKRNVPIQIKLGGDLMNAVYVFGLAGFSSNHPCVFCTQHKDDLHITEETAYDKTVVEGKGKTKKTTVTRIGATSYHDLNKRARSLAEQKLCILEKNNALGYKHEPLFGDLFEYTDYCVDTLHMKLRIFDIILKDMLSHASRTGKYGSEHLAIIENKIKILNQHCQKTVGKRFFFQVDVDDKNKTITSHGKLSGHLQDFFFVDTFPYDDVLDDELAQSARVVVNKFKELLQEVKANSKTHNDRLKFLSIQFVNVFRASGLRTTVTPYIHIIGNHLFEFNQLNDLGDFNMQGVEKSNDLLSRLYFSSTNPAKYPLLTMLQKLYRMLEMNFENQNHRDAMAEFARTGVYDLVDDAALERRSSYKHKDGKFFNINDEQEEESSNKDKDQYVASLDETNESEDQNNIDLNESMIQTIEKRLNITSPSMNRKQL
ncbi:unnamed protein product [Rotaria magnacalcarata]|nr:unnamed protein product [Rotaria magnacalcarata]